jgi:hypothetical protein
VNVELLTADITELDELGLDVQQAFERGCKAIGNRPTRERIAEKPDTEAGVAELVDLFAERSADLHLVRFSFATAAPEYDRSTCAFDAIDARGREIQRDVAPTLRARLRELRTREAELERAVAMRGLDPRTIGPMVPAGEAIDPTKRPGEGPRERRHLTPLPVRRSLLSRLRRRGPR